MKKLISTSAKTLFKTLWDEAPEDVFIHKIVTDNREVEQNSVFVAIKGEKVDGHNFAKKAIDDGALYVIAQHTISGVNEEKIIIVNDPLDAMIAMGDNYRSQFSPLVLGITGSVGKTTTKEFAAQIFSHFGATVSTQGNQNNEIGLPKTLFNLTPTTQYAVLEMGMQGLGEIRKLTMAAKPNAAIISNIGTAHIEHLGSREAIWQAKMEICEGLPDDAPLILNGDNDLLLENDTPKRLNTVYVGIQNEISAVRAINIKQQNDGQAFTLLDRDFGEQPVFIPTLGEHNVLNALLAYTAATRLGLPAQKVAALLSAYKPSGLRQKIEVFNGITLIEDCYNASPDSMQAALSVLHNYKASGRKIAVLGDMKELGDTAQEAHEQVGKLCAEYKVDLLIAVGYLSCRYTVEQAALCGVRVLPCENNEEAVVFLKQGAHYGDVVLFKASRSMKFEQIIDSFTGTE